MGTNETIHDMALLGRKIRTGFVAFVGERIEGGPSPVEGRMLAFIIDHPSCNSADIREAFRLTKSTVSELLTSLANLGLIRLERSPDDARQKTIVVTEKGFAHKAKIDEICEVYDEAISKGITEEEAEIIKKVTEKIHKNIEEVVGNGNE